MSERKFVTGAVKTEQGFHTGQVLAQFTSDSKGETLSLAVNGILIAVPFGDVEKMIAKERKNSRVTWRS